jgi:hypothetical protein
MILEATFSHPRFAQMQILFSVGSESVSSFVGFEVLVAMVCSTMYTGIRLPTLQRSFCLHQQSHPSHCPGDGGSKDL